MGKITNSIQEGITRFFGSAGESFTTWAVNTFTKWSRKKLLKQYKGLVYACINAIAEDFAKYEPIFYKIDRRSGQKKAYRHPFAEVIENPNPSLSKFDLMFATAAFLELTGDAFWYYALGERSRTPKEIYLMRPDKVEVVVDGKTGEVIGYKFRQDDGTKIPLDVDEVEHIHTFHPENPYRGMGTLEAGITYVEIENDTSTFQRNFMKNQATPSGVLTISGKIEKEAFNKLKQQWKEKQAGLANVGKTLFIREADAKFTKIGLSLGELDMKALKELSEEKLYKMFRVPQIILGHTDQSGLGRANAETADYIFAKRNIDPKQTRLDDSLQRTLRRNYKETNTVIGHVSQIPEDRTAELAEADKGVGRWITVNEMRQKKGMPTVDGGDELYVSFNQVPINDAGNDNGGESSGKSVKKIRKLVVRKDTAEQTFFRQLERIDNKGTRDYKKKNNSFIEQQRKRVLEGLKAYGAAAPNAKTKAYEEILPNAEEEADKAVEELLIILLLAMQQAGETAFKFLDNVDEFLISDTVRNNLSTAARRVLRDHTNQTIVALQKSIADGVTNNETIEQLTARVNKIYDEAVGWRAERLSNSEAHKYVNKGLQEAYIQSGITQKEWRALGSNPCEFCLAMDGTIVNVDSIYVPKGSSIDGVDGGEYINDYEDIENANAHSNCHCWLFPVR